MSTTDNLKDAFAGESQANRKYLAYGEQAAKDGFQQVAKLFRAVAEAETIHAHAHLRAMDGVGNTVANIEDAMKGELYEFTEMYPPMLATAKEEGHKGAERSMSHALDVERVHHSLFSEALEAVKAGKDLPAEAVRICSVCGHTVTGDAPDACPVCKARGAKFVEVS